MAVKKEEEEEEELETESKKSKKKDKELSLMDLPGVLCGMIIAVRILDCTLLESLGRFVLGITLALERR